MRLPNKYGSITKIKDTARRRPFWVRKLIGYEVLEEERKVKRIYKTIGYYATRSEALAALADYNADPLKHDVSMFSFNDVYEHFSKEKFAEISEKTQKNYRMSIKKFSVLNDRNFASLTALDYEQFVDGMARTTRTQCKNLLIGMYEWAMRHEVTDRNVGKMVNFHEDKKTQLVRTVFTEDEVKALWDMIDDNVARMILFSLYSGVRPAELWIIKMEDVHLEEGYLRTGVKTEAGINRIVPIHKDVESMIRSCYEMAKQKGQSFLFVQANKSEFSSPMYHRGFKRVMASIGADHMPHDTRHTFIDRAHHNSVQIDETKLKLIVGHKVSDTTQGVYTHYTSVDLKEEIDKIVI